MTLTRDDRGQLMLGTAIILAIAIIALAIFINTAAITNPNTQTGHTIKNDGILTNHIHKSTRELIIRENTVEYTTQANATAATRSGIHQITNTTANRTFERQGSILTVEITTLTPGIIVAQDTNRDYTSGGPTPGDTEWTLGTSDRVRAFNNTFDPASLKPVTNDQLNTSTPAQPSDSDAFRINVTGDNGNTWNGYITNGDNSDVLIIEENETGAHTACRLNTTDTTVTVTWTRNTLNGHPCDMTFANNLTAPLTVTYERAGNITGQYSIVLSNETNTSINTNNLGSPGATTSPRFYHAAYSATLTVTNTGERVTTAEHLPIIAPEPRESTR